VLLLDVQEMAVPTQKVVALHSLIHHMLKFTGVLLRLQCFSLVNCRLFIVYIFQSWVFAFFSRWLLLSMAWFVFNGLPALLHQLPQLSFVAFLAQYLSSPLYNPWSLWFMDYYWLAFTLAGPLYFFEQRGRFTLANDKYQAFVVFLLQPVLRDRLTIHWSPLVRLGLLSVILKLFFLPYMVTWGLQNALQLWNTLDTWPTDFRAWTRLLIQLCLLLDVLIFGIGYLLESKRLDCEIRSVDPSIWGWLACLCCYPPFNSFSFLTFDKAFFPINMETSETVRLCFNGLEVLCWIIFAWASVALGFKASNLTARGTVSHGPYRWLRHPAYTAKLTVWWIQGIIFGEFTVGILLAFTAVYVARALTEERHLLQVDADYAAYCHKVRRRFMPCLI
jgi:protein-S-isoprenylcysteine O-methyltransferase Ste14